MILGNAVFGPLDGVDKVGLEELRHLPNIAGHHQPQPVTVSLPGSKRGENKCA